MRFCTSKIEHEAMYLKWFEILFKNFQKNQIDLLPVGRQVWFVLCQDKMNVKGLVNYNSIMNFIIFKLI